MPDSRSLVASESHPAIAALTATDLEPILLPPDRVGFPSSWWGHVPFAHLLVHELKPDLIVELGTQHGVSFAAFCNAVRRHGLATRCYAVDTWQGDEHSGLYDESVFNGINTFVQQNYSSFATLIRSSFHEAIGRFADGSIDLLNIDGLHTYEAVKADFESWLPKLSPRGVALFHDIEIFDRGFGVWRFWQEICQGHPSFEFHHSCGLGVLAPGPVLPRFISALVEMEPAVAATVRQRLAQLGERWASDDGRARASAAVDALNRCQQLVQEENAKLRQEIRQADDAVAVTRESLAQSHQIVAALMEVTAVQRTQLAGHSLNGDALRHQLSSLTQHADRLGARLEQIRASTSWRMTSPYRVAGRLIKRQVMGALMGSATRRQQVRDWKLISRAKAFNAPFYLGREAAPGEDDDLIMDYLASSRNAVQQGRKNTGDPVRRPMPGFHPLAYAEQCKAYDRSTGEDPLAHYLRNGSPEGPWTHDVIRPDASPACVTNRLRILIHAHFHYPDLFDDLLRRLAGNKSTGDLLVTTTSEVKAAEIREVLTAHSEQATVVVVPNRGRDVGPMLMHFRQFEGYDIIGHVHGKRSPQQPGTKGDDWRDFLWNHLIGGAEPMMDVIAEAFAADRRLGLLFPEDPNLTGWDTNESLANTLAIRMGLQHPLPQHIEFPQGTMFWARPAALRPLADLGWEWSDFPTEPVAFDGTILHALERVMPIAAEQAGFHFGTVHVPNSWRGV
jgi:hypothetical protein